jgi:hypothetical protein
MKEEGRRRKGERESRKEEDGEGRMKEEGRRRNA